MMYEKIQLSHAILTAYCPYLCSVNANGPKRPAIVICGGGGYAYVSNRETEPVAIRFLTMGLCAFTIEYRVSPDRYPAGLQDVGEAVAWVRANADQLGVDPDRIAVCGFSAGGHVAANLGVAWHDAEIFAPLGLTPADVRPNAMILSYPVITSNEFAHRGSFENLTGSDDLAVHAAHSLEHQVSSNTPPTFLWHTWEDSAVPVENTLLFAAALRRAGCTAEVHIYPKGHHGLSLANELTGTEADGGIVPELQSWPELAGRFLRQILG